MTESKALSVVDDVCNSIQKMEKQFKDSLPPQIPVERFVGCNDAMRTSTGWWALSLMRLFLMS